MTPDKLLLVCDGPGHYRRTLCAFIPPYGVPFGAYVSAIADVLPHLKGDTYRCADHGHAYRTLLPVLNVAEVAALVGAGADDLPEEN